VRRRAVEDLPGCVRVLEAVHAADAYPMWWPADPAGWLSPVGWTAAWVAEVAGVVVGHVCVVRGVEDPLVASLTGAGPDQLGTVSRLFIAPEARGRELGGSLLTAGSSYASELGLQLMLDVVDDGGPAVALYERLGWRLVDRRLADWTTPQGDPQTKTRSRQPALRTSANAGCPAGAFGFGGCRLSRLSLNRDPPQSVSRPQDPT
jgi:GNAT superfamily N-acetyltransferase